MKRWDLYWANVPLEEIAGQSKVRPAVILVVKDEYILAVKVTSHDARENDKFDYVLKYWRQAGLSKPSVVRVQKLVQLSDYDIGGYIGTLQAEDIQQIRILMKQYKEEHT